MKDVTSELQDLLGKLLSSHLRLKGHSCMLELRGYCRLAHKYECHAERREEHAEWLMKCIDAMGTIPAYTTTEEFEPLSEWDILELLNTDLEIELALCDALAECKNYASKDGAYAVSEKLDKIMVETYKHATWLRTQVAQTDEMGVPLYLMLQALPVEPEQRPEH
jgi:bacterioferritin (cytochrome b1)